MSAPEGAMDRPPARVIGLDHVQLAMPRGHEDAARRFYRDLLGLEEITKPKLLASRGGAWFEGQGTVVHLGVEPDFTPARKAHPAFLVRDLEACRARLAAAGVPITPDESLPGVRRFYVADPFGNRIELIQNGDGFAQNSERAARALESAPPRSPGSLQTERLQILHEIDRAILAVRAPAEIAASAAARVRRATNATRVSVLLWNEDGTAFDVLAVDGEVNPEASAGMRLPMQAYQGYAANLRGETSIVEDMATLPNPTPSIREAVAQGVRSNAGLPLIAGELPLGALLIARAGTGRLSEEMLDLARHVADSLAVAIQNARLFEEVRRSRAALQELSRRLVQVQEAERRSLGRDLHDTSAQTMTALKVGITLLARDAACPPAVCDELHRLGQVADSVSDELHRLAVNLRPPSLDRFGLVAAVDQFISALRAHGAPEVSFVARGLGDDRLPDDVETALYRIVQESLTNVVRHAGASSVSVMLQKEEGSVRLIVEDDGTGFDVGSALSRGRLGLLGIRERAELLGGSFSIESDTAQPEAPGPAAHGTTLFVEIPLA